MGGLLGSSDAACFGSAIQGIGDSGSVDELHEAEHEVIGVAGDDAAEPGAGRRPKR